MSANWTGYPPDEPGRHGRHVRRDTRPWYRRVDWFSAIVMMVAIVMVCCAACWLFLHPEVSL